jgi:hypothetical protein
MLYRMLTSQSLALHRSRNITGQKGWITQDQTPHGRRLGVGKQEIGQTKRHQSTEGITHQPKRDSRKFSGNSGAKFSRLPRSSMAPCRRSTVVVFEFSTAGKFNEAQQASGGKIIGLF